MEISPIKKYCAEFFGTLVLTFFGCGTAVIAGSYVGTLGIAFAFGLSIIATAFVIGNVSGCHINPAISLAMFLDKRLSLKDMIGYWIAQLIGAFVAAVLLVIVIALSGMGDVATVGLGTNGFGDASNSALNMGGAIIVEIILTAVFVLTVLGATADEKTGAYAGIIIGLTLTFVHIIGIPLTGTSVNPARSFGPALMLLFCGDSLAISQLWVFIVAPLIGAVVAYLLWKAFSVNKEAATEAKAKTEAEAE